MKQAQAKAPDGRAVDAISDDALMLRVAARDEAAFRTIIDRHAARPHRIAWRMLGDAVEAEDVAQEALLRLWDGARRWQAQTGGVSAWLARVATNICLDRLRRAKFASDDPVPERADETPLADAALQAEQVRERTLACLKALPERQHGAIVLTYYEGLTNAQAAAILEMNVKAFESLLLRARHALRELLAAQGLNSGEDVL